MLRISDFYGIAVYMYPEDHAPPHLHAFYGEFEAKMSLETLEITHGQFPHRPMRLLRQWVALHREELEENWRIAESAGRLKRIEPLP